MLRSFWQRAKDFVWNSVTSVFRTQTEIDAEVETYIGDYGSVVSSPSPTHKIRPKGLFMSPSDLARYADPIPSEYVEIVELPFYEDDNTFYQVYVDEGGQ